MEFVASLLHILGLMLFGGGQIWLALLMSRAESSPTPQAKSFVLGSLRHLSVAMGAGILMLWGSGVGRLLIWKNPGLLFLPQLYGWILMAKILLYIVIVANGILIERRYIWGMSQNTSLWSDESFPQKWEGLKLLSRMNLLLTLVVVALGEALRFSPA